MIAANKRFLKANLTQGVLSIQQNLVDLYNHNVSSMNTQAALIGGFSFTALLLNYENTGGDDDGSSGGGYTNSSSVYSSFNSSGTTGASSNDDSLPLSVQVLSYFFYTCFAITFTCSLYILSVGTIVVMFGPTLALKGSTDDAVKFAATQMRKIQLKLLRVAFVAISALFVGACLLSWAIYARGMAILTMCVYLFVYLILVSHGFDAYRLFNPLVDGVFVEPDAIGYHADGRKMTAREYKEELDRKEKERLQDALEATKLKVKGILWKRQALEDGGLFIKYYAVLEKGRLDFYKNEKDYRENSNPANSKPVKLWQYNLELDHRKYQQNVTFISNAVMSTFIGSEEFALTDLMKSEHDLQFAARNYKFGLMPKVTSELFASTTHEFLAHDEATYRLWTEAFDSVLSAFNEIAASPSLDQTIRVGTADVELVVQAANNRYDRNN